MFLSSNFDAFNYFESFRREEIIIDYQSDEFELERVIKGAERRMTICGFDVDLMILHKGKLICVKRYKK